MSVQNTAQGTAKIALVDDDRNILTSVTMALEAEGFDVKTYTDGEAALDGLSLNAADIGVFDIKMPRMDGMELLKNLRETSTMPVIFLTSKDDEIDQILGLKMGADDYITKPFSQRLLVERIRALLRREAFRASDNDNEDDQDALLVRGDLSLDKNKHICLWKGAVVNLTVTEFMLVETLARRPGHVKSRDQLMDEAYGDSIYVDDRTIDSHIKRVRKKFKQTGYDFDLIETVYGVGYRYSDVEA